MIDKVITYIYGDNNSEVMRLIHPNALEKTAEISDDIISFIKNLIPTKGKDYALINALSAGEYYGSNKNGDYFPEKALKSHHKTFEQYGHVYEHHINKDPNKSIGKVIFSFYNPKMHRVELVVELDKIKAKHVINKLNQGDLVATSMGAKVPYDECSLCHNKAKTRSEYCNHLKHMMNAVLPGGKKVYAINDIPKFFDISVVTIPAEVTSAMLKILSDLIYNNEEHELKKVAFYLENNYTKLAEFSSLAEISKKVENIEKVTKMSDNLAELILDNQKRLDKETIEKLSEYPFSSILSTFLGLRIVPDPRDFQKLALYTQGLKKEADYMEQNGIIFKIPEEPLITKGIILDNFNEKIAELLIDNISNTALTREFILTRNIIKLADNDVSTGVDSRALWKQMLFDKKPEYQLTAHKNPIMPLGILGGLYYGYTKIFNDVSTSGFKEFISKYPWLLPVLVGAGTAGSLIAQNNSFNKTGSAVDSFIRNSLISFPISYYMSAKKEFKAKQEPITGTENFIRKHPALIAIAGALAGVKAEKLFKTRFIKTAEFISRLPEDEINSIYMDLLNI